MYQTLYRKYRPKNFDEVIGQDAIVKTFVNSIKNNKISHAYLFAGPHGNGKTSLAKILAKTVNCEQTFDYNPCEKCQSCMQANNGQNIDIIEIDAASNNGVDEIRELKSKVNLVPSYGKYKVYIIDEVHMLTPEAFNALLKTLEEPPSFVIFVLATTEPHRIPATILSRCQRYDFKKMSIHNIVTNLTMIIQKEKIKIDEDALIEIANLADGAMRDAIGILEQVWLYASEKITLKDVNEVNGLISYKDVFEFVKLINKNDIVKSLDKLDLYYESGKNMIRFIEKILSSLKNVLICKAAPDYFEKGDEKQMYEELSGDMDSDIINDYIIQLNEILFNTKKTGSTKLMLELFIIKNCIEKKVDIDKTAEVRVINIKEKQEEISEDAEKEHKGEVKEELEEEQKEKINEELEKKQEENNPDDGDIKLLDIKKIRINNTLHAFDKNLLKDLKNEILTLKDMLIDSEYGNLVSLILDGELKAASKENMIFVFEKDKISEYFNYEIPKIEKLLEKKMKVKYKIISVSKTEWEVIKKEFNNKEKVYQYVEEKFDIKKIIKRESKNADDITNMFGSIVEHK